MSITILIWVTVAAAVLDMATSRGERMSVGTSRMFITVDGKGNLMINEEDEVG